MTGPENYAEAEWMDDDYCEHDCDEECLDAAGNNVCLHEHCPWCGGCGCPGYCDHYQTYNLPDEVAP